MKIKKWYCNKAKNFVNKNWFWLKKLFKDAEDIGQLKKFKNTK